MNSDDKVFGQCELKSTICNHNTRCNRSWYHDAWPNSWVGCTKTWFMYTTCMCCYSWHLASWKTYITWFYLVQKIDKCNTVEVDNMHLEIYCQKPMKANRLHMILSSTKNRQMQHSWSGQYAFENKMFHFL